MGGVVEGGPQRIKRFDQFGDTSAAVPCKVAVGGLERVEVRVEEHDFEIDLFNVQGHGVYLRRCCAAMDILLV